MCAQCIKESTTFPRTCSRLMEYFRRERYLGRRGSARRGWMNFSGMDVCGLFVKYSMGVFF